MVVWKLSRDTDHEKTIVNGKMERRLVGHSHFISDIAISSDKQYALSSSWDHTLRLWNLNTGATNKRFVDHKKDVLSVSFSVDNRQIVSGSRDKSIKVWNTFSFHPFSSFHLFIYLFFFF